MTKSELIYFLLGSMTNKSLRKSISDTESDEVLSVLISQSIYNFEIKDNRFYIIDKRQIENYIEFL